MAKKKSKKKHKKAKQEVRKQTTPKVSTANKTTKKSAVKPTINKSTKVAGTEGPSSRKYLVLVIAIVLSALVITVLVLANRTNEAKNDATNTGQEDLLRVQPGNPDNLQPNGSTDTNPQQSSPSPQGDGGAANEIQPQTPVTPEQQEQIQ